MGKLTTNPVPGHASIHECIAHRCPQHDGIDTILDEDRTVEDGSECSYCVAQRVIRQLVTETFFPIAVAFEKAEGGLRLLGVHNNPSTKPLFLLLHALTEKTGENDFELVAQKVIAGVLEAKGPEGVQ